MFIVRWASGVTTIRQRPVGGPSVAGGAAEGDAGGAQVVGEHGAELVVADPADVGGPSAEAGHAGDRVGGRPSGGLDALRPWRRRGPRPARCR